MAGKRPDPSSWACELLIVRHPRQARLSQRSILPIVDELDTLARRVRQEVDEKLRPEARAEYPKEYCEEIRDAAWPVFSSHPLIRRLQRQGLEWRRVFFIEKGQFFLNSIQLGDYLFDITNDTDDVRKDPVRVMPLDELHYENLDSWQRYREVGEAKFHARLIPNTVFPLLFPLLPFLALMENGNLVLPVHQDLLFHLDWADRSWPRARSLLRDTAFMAQELPEPARIRMDRLAKENGGNGFPAEYRPSSAAQIDAGLDEWKAVRKLSNDRQTAILGSLLNLARDTAKRVHRAGVRWE